MTTLIPSRRFLYVLLASLTLLVAGGDRPADAGGLDMGWFEFFAAGETDQVAWIWVEDSTSDGDGTEYIAFLSSYDPPGANNTSYETTTDYGGTANFPNVSAFVDWIVTNHAHVSSSADLTVYKRVVSTVNI